MTESKEILEKKSKETVSLKESVNDNTNENTVDEQFPQRQVDSEGRSILVFKDPLFSREKRAVVNYTIFRGKWEFEILDEIDDDDTEKCAVKFIPTNESSNVTIAFKSIKDRLEFMDSIYADNAMKQSGTGMSLEKYANSKVLQTGGLVGLATLAGLGLYKLFRK
ncbi:MAG: hypothetical protein Q8903_06350 [Bacteroidota bacterium]|nr:hypothetical protein [Bacteroidota bacterium]